MTIDKRDILRPGEDYLTPTYGRSYFTEDLEAGILPESEMPARAVRQIISDDLQLDGNPVLNLASFVTTWMEDEAHELMSQTINKNFVDEDEYPQTARIHQRVMKMMAQLFNAPEGADPFGVATVGSSEAIMLGLLAHKWAWRDRRKKQGLPYDKPNIVFGRDVHTCWEKFTKYFDVEWRAIDLQPGKYVISLDDVKDKIDENTIAVGCVLGTTFTGQSDPIQEINDYLVELKKETDGNIDIPIHVDAASGGFVYPFINPHVEWDFRLEQVLSINTSNHKFGLVYPGMGTIMFRDKSCVPEELIFDINYLGGNMPNYSLNFSRPSAYVISQYYNFLRLGKEGYRKVHTACYETAAYLAGEVQKMGPFEVIYGGEMDGGIPALCWRMKAGVDPGFSLYDLADRLRTRGWQVPAYSLPADCQDLVIQRILVRHGVSRDLGSLLIDDMRRAIDYFKQHPVHTPMTAEEASVFHH